MNSTRTGAGRADAAASSGATSSGRRPASLRFLLMTAAVATVWSLMGAQEYDVWFFELVPGLAGVIGLDWVARRRFCFSAAVYLTISVAFVFIAAGARYSYAEFPLFDRLQEEMGWSRNHFDRCGHFLQGFTVALMTREILLRTTSLGRRLGIPLLSAAFALAFSAFYELVEWWCVRAFYPDHGQEWLGTQGDEWDAQWDMLMALLGGLAAVLAAPRLHDRSIGDRLRWISDASESQPKEVLPAGQSL